MGSVKPYLKILAASTNFRQLSLNALDIAYTFREGVPVGVKNQRLVHFYSERHPDAMEESFQINHELNKLLTVKGLNESAIEIKQLRAQDRVAKLIRLDREATVEAKKSKGFIVYNHDEEVGLDGIASSFCIWETAEDATEASKHPLHMAAVKYVAESIYSHNPIYLRYTISKYSLSRPSEEELTLVLDKRMNFEPEMFEPVTKIPDTLAA